MIDRNESLIMYLQHYKKKYNFFSGRILNRFSKDIGTIDELLPKIILEALQMTSVVLAIFIMVAILNRWMIIPIIIQIILFYLWTKFYLKTAQSIKRLEGVSKYLEIESKREKEREVIIQSIIYIS